MKEVRIIEKSLLLLFTVFLINSCYYDNGDDLLTGNTDCDTTNMTYTQNIEPIISSYCVGCHSGSAPSAGISLETYNDVKQSADNGDLLGTIKHMPGYSAMPKNSSQLDDCTISQIEAWINAGTPN